MKARFLTLWTVAVLAAAASFIVHLTLRYETVRLGYQVSEQRTQQLRLLEQKRMLALEAATLRQSDRVETVARSNFQMDVVTPQHVIAIGKNAPRVALSGRAQ